MPRHSTPTGSCRRALLGRVCLLSLLLTGCTWNWPFAREDRLVIDPLPPEIDKAQLVEFLNANARQVRAWRCDDATITAKGLPARLSATVAVESPKRFRLVVSSIAGNEADFGSNDERFWFWMRRGNPKHVFTVSHRDFERLGPRMQIPFQPDWLMEVLGVTLLDPNEYQLHHDPANAAIRLVAERLTPDGRRVRRVIVVDMRRSVIVEHSLYDDGGRLLAKASMFDHRTEPSGVTMPHQIRLEWPQTNLAMTMTLGPLDINPAHLPEAMWQVPNIPDYPPLDLGCLHERNPAVRPAEFGERLQR